MSNDDIEFVTDLPQPKYGTGLGQSYDRKVARLAERPGCWGVIRRSKSTGALTQLKWRLRQRHGDEKYEYAIRSTGETERALHMRLRLAGQANDGVGSEA